MIAGIDFSSRAIDVVLIADEGFPLRPQHHRFEIATKDGPLAAARNVRGALPGRSWWEDRQVWLAGIEDPYSRQPRAIVALNRILGAVAATLPPGICVIPTPQSEWLKIYTGRATIPTRSADRKALAAETGRLFGFEPSSPDGYDALGIACAVRALNEDGVRRAAPAA